MNKNCWYPTTKLHSVRSQETSFFLVILFNDASPIARG